MRWKAAFRWVSPSFTAACAGALLAGVLDGLGEPSVVTRGAVVGFAGLAVLPILFVLGLALRGVYVAWQPRALGDAMAATNGGVGASLGGWILAILTTLAALAVAMFASVYALARASSFRPLVVSFVLALVAIVATAGLVLVALPMQRAYAAALARLGGRARTVLLAIGGATLVGIVGALLLVKHMVGELSLEPVATLGAAVAVAVAVHVWWRPLLALVVPLALAACALAIYTRASDPSDTLGVWSDHAVSGFVIDKLFDVDTIRGELSTAELAPTPRPGAPHPDIILVTIDTVRADHTPPYGGGAKMPVLAGLASRGVVFEWAFSPSNVTRRSIPSMITGLDPDHVKGRVVGWALHLDPRHVVLAERLRAAGYETAGFMCCDGFWGPDAHTGLARGLDHVEIEHDGAGLSARANRWLTARKSTQPLFVWVHILEPHNWMDAQGVPNTDEQRTKYYDNVLANCDRMLGAILDPLAAKKPIVIVTADHGEGLGDHGSPFHSTDLYNSQSHVPFVIAGDSLVPRRVSETVSLVDLAPTILELAGYIPAGTADAHFDGRSIAPLATGATVDDPAGGWAYLAMIKDRSNPGGEEAFVAGKWKLIRGARGIELYDTRADPGEHDDVAPAHPDIVACLTKNLEAHALVCH